VPTISFNQLSRTPFENLGPFGSKRIYHSKANLNSQTIFDLRSRPFLERLLDQT